MRPRIADPRSDMSQDERDAPAAADGPRGAAPGTCHAEPTVCGMVPRPGKRHRSGRTLCAQAGSCRDRAASDCRPVAWPGVYWCTAEGTIVLLTVFRKTRQHDQRQIDRAVRAQKTCERDHRGAAAQTYERQV
jgi:hypothetical protein